MAKILAFDTATAACSVALSVKGEIYEQFEIAPRKHGQLILGMVQHLLSAAGMSLTDLDAIAYGCGPGSFMGIRLATGIAQGLAFGADKPLIPVSSLQTLAQSAYLGTQAPQIAAAWDARMQAIYWGVYRCDEAGLMQSVQSDTLSQPGQLMLPTGSWLAAGNAWKVYADKLIPEISNDLPFSTGVLGYLGYGIRHQLETLPTLAKKDIHLPDACIGLYDWSIVVDHCEKKNLVSHIEQ